MIRLPDSIDYEEVPLENRYRTATRALSARIGALYAGAFEEFGPDALDLIRSVGEEHGRELAEALSGEGPPQDAQGAALCLARLMDLVGMTGRVTELSPEVARIQIETCPYGISDPALCEAKTSLELAFVRALGDSLVLEVEKSAARGDAVCQFKVLRKS